MTSTETVNFDALEKEMAELNEIKKAWDKAWDRVWEIWGICSKNEKEFWEWHNKKHPKTVEPKPEEGQHNGTTTIV